MNISTAASMALIWLSCSIIQQYTNAYSQELRTIFSVKFGCTVVVMTALLIIDGLSLFGALFIAILTSYDIIPAIISVVVVTLGFIGMVRKVFIDILINI